MKLIHNVDLYAPEHLGKKDILLEANRIATIGDDLSEYEKLPGIETIDGTDLFAVPGLIDLHVHITGGGGEQGPSSRVPESTLSAFIRSGVTTVVGLLGTDGITRSMDNLLAKAQALTDEGITALFLTGSYALPSTTITGSVERDLVLFRDCVGSKIAVSDHRGSNPTVEELIRLGTATRRGGMLSGTAGFVTVHMGSGKAGLDPLFEAMEQSDLPWKTFLPTHMGYRSMELFERGVEWTKWGGKMDITAGEDIEENRMIAGRILHALSNGSPADSLTISSDSFGSMPRFDEKGNCIGLTYALPNSLLELLRVLVTEKGLSLETAIFLFTKNPANVLERTDKGHIAEGAEADILLLDKNLALHSVIAKGALAMSAGELRLKGKFEV